MVPARKTFADELERALVGKGGDEAKVAFVATLNRHLPPGKKATLVGGGLVEVYTRGRVTRIDVGLVGPRHRIMEVLEGAGSLREGRPWWGQRFDLVVDVAAATLGGSRPVVEVRLGGHAVPAVSLEDSLADRLSVAKHWRSYRDWERSVILYDANRARFDEARLDRRAQEEDVADFLERVHKPLGRKPAG